MSGMDEAKKQYGDIVIPEELSQRVQDAVERSGAKRGKVIRLQRRKRAVKRSMISAAAVLVVFVTAANTSTAFAETVGKMPVLGTIARVLTVQSYIKEDGDLKLSVEIPSVELIAGDTGLVDSVNQEIYGLCEQYADEAVKRAEEYKKAFLDTGGTEEEWSAHQIEIKVGYEIKSQSDRYLSFLVSGSENWASAYSETRYYTLDLESGKTVSLKDILGDGYIEAADSSIEKQMDDRSAQGIPFWPANEGGFAGISDDSRFYVNEKGNPVIVFEKYEIAPGAYGMIEFEIEK